MRGICLTVFCSYKDFFSFSFSTITLYVFPLVVLKVKSQVTISQIAGLTGFGQNDGF